MDTRRVGGERPRVELYLRSLAPGAGRDEQDRVVERLQRLDGSDCVRALEVHVCGTCVCSSTPAAETDPGQFLLSRFDQFESWADDHGRSLVGFRRQCVDSSLAGGMVTGVRFPRMTVAEFVGGDLRFVAPSRGSTTVTVTDRVDELASTDRSATHD